MMDEAQDKHDGPAPKNQGNSGFAELALRVALPVGIVALGWIGYSLPFRRYKSFGTPLGV